MNRGYPSSFYQSQRPWLINIIILVWLPAPTCQLLLSDNSQTEVTQWLTSLCNGCNVLSDSCGYLYQRSLKRSWTMKIFLLDLLKSYFSIHLQDVSKKCILTLSLWRGKKYDSSGVSTFLYYFCKSSPKSQKYLIMHS